MEVQIPLGALRDFEGTFTSNLPNNVRTYGPTKYKRLTGRTLTRLGYEKTVELNTILFSFTGNGSTRLSWKREHNYY